MKETKTTYLKARVTPTVDQQYRNVCAGLGVKTAEHMRTLVEAFLEKHQSESNEVFVDIYNMAPGLQEVTVRIPCLQQLTCFFEYTELRVFPISPLVDYIASGVVRDVKKLGIVRNGIFKGVVSTTADNPEAEVRKYLTRIFTLLIPHMKGLK
jgi:hypothetical protein